MRLCSRNAGHLLGPIDFRNMPTKRSALQFDSVIQNLDFDREFFALTLPR
jgi:hypothetical protein